MSDEAAPTPEEAVKLRGDPPRVMRLKNKKVYFVVDRVIDRMVK